MDGSTRVTVDASYVPTGDMTILAEMADAPQQITASITQQPRDEIVTEGEKAVFTVAAVSAPAGTALQYQWYRSTDDGKTFTAISGATEATYTSSATTLKNDGYQYKCAVTPQAQGALQAESAVAKLFVREAGDPGSTVPETGDSPMLYIFVAIAALCTIGLVTSPPAEAQKRLNQPCALADRTLPGMLVLATRIPPPSFCESAALCGAFAPIQGCVRGGRARGHGRARPVCIARPLRGAGGGGGSGKVTGSGGSCNGSRRSAPTCSAGCPGTRQSADSARSRARAGRTAAR